MPNLNCPQHHGPHHPSQTPPPQCAAPDPEPEPALGLPSAPAGCGAAVAAGAAPPGPATAAVVSMRILRSILSSSRASRIWSRRAFSTAAFSSASRRLRSAFSWMVTSALARQAADACRICHLWPPGSPSKMYSFCRSTTCVFHPASAMRCSPPFTLDTVVLNVLPAALTCRYLVSPGLSSTLLKTLMRVFAQASMCMAWLCL
mmetsp:Transcript_32675/g.82911  ORF Transcript_32675/g.82911 Transcript_32675/m.82911 type:complete len:203 (+) Transcript_32675:266-874(+)